ADAHRALLARAPVSKRAWSDIHVGDQVTAHGKRGGGFDGDVIGEVDKDIGPEVDAIADAEAGEIAVGVHDVDGAVDGDVLADGGTELAQDLDMGVRGEAEFHGDAFDAIAEVAGAAA